MKIEAVDLRRISIPMIAPFRVSFGVETSATSCSSASSPAMPRVGASASPCPGPLYSPEYVDGGRGRHPPSPAAAALRGGRRRRRPGRPEILPPDPGSSDGEGGARDGRPRRRAASRRRLARATTSGRSATEVDCGVSVGIHEDPAELLDVVGGYLAEGYVRIKLKIEPGLGRRARRAPSANASATILLQVDANTAYTLADAAAAGQARRVRPAADRAAARRGRRARPRRAGAAHHARRSASTSRSPRPGRPPTPSRSAPAAIVNIKAGRVGGYLEARRIHDVCAAHGVPVWCGGMLETGLGRAANVALAALPGFTLPGDTSASGRYYAQDITEPFVLHDGRLDGSAGPGPRRDADPGDPRRAHDLAQRPSGQRALCHRASSPSSRNCSSSTRRSSAFFTSMSKSSPSRRSR